MNQGSSKGCLFDKAVAAILKATHGSQVIVPLESFGSNTVKRGFARCGTHLYVHDFVPPPGFLFIWRGIEKTTKNT